MNIISTLRNKQKTLIIAGSLLFGLALTPITSNAANAEYERYRNNEMHNTHRHQGNRHAEKNIRHHNTHAYADHHHHVPRGHHRYHHKHRNHHHKKRYHRSHYHRKPHYVVNHHHHYHHPDRYALQMGAHRGHFDIIVRD